MYSTKRDLVYVYVGKSALPPTRPVSSSVPLTYTVIKPGLC